MTTVEDIWEGQLFAVDCDYGDKYDVNEEELLTPIEVRRQGGFSCITWFWLTGPDAGTTFKGQAYAFNQQISVTRVL